MESAEQSQISEAKVILDRSKHTVFFTGAGISTPSGIPDFRSPGSGLWEKYDPFAVASLSAFKNNPERFFDWIKPLYLQSKNAQPNSAHHAIAELERRGKAQSVITQNIDGLHHAAGSQNVITLHGTVETATCPKCRHGYDGDKLLALYIERDELPVCRKCGSLIKPDVILYEEPLPKDAWEKAAREMRKAQAVFVVGSSLETYPANTLPEIAVSHGAHLVIITLSETPMDQIASVLIHEDVTLALPALLSQNEI